MRNEDTLQFGGRSLRICRGCDLSCEVEIHFEGEGCEACDDGEPLTPKIIKDLAALIPRGEPRVRDVVIEASPMSFERAVDLVRNAIMMNSSPSIDRSDAHGCRGQSAYHVVENHVVFIAGDIARKWGRAERTGSNPFKNLAEDFALPYEAVVCFAERIRRIKAAGGSTKEIVDLVDKEYPWGKWGAEQVAEKLGEQEFHAVLGLMLVLTGSVGVV